MVSKATLMLPIILPALAAGKNDNRRRYVSMK